jgi:hypothetical protein
MQHKQACLCHEDSLRHEDSLCHEDNVLLSDTQYNRELSARARRRSIRAPGSPPKPPNNGK